MKSYNCLQMKIVVRNVPCECVIKHIMSSHTWIRPTVTCRLGSHQNGSSLTNITIIDLQFICILCGSKQFLSNYRKKDRVNVCVEHFIFQITIKQYKNE